MTNFLESANRWLSGQIDQHLSSSVVYKRGSLAVPVNASKGRTTFEIQDSNGILIAVESRDFLITADNLVLDGIRSIPEVGDRIVETRDGVFEAYEVSNFGLEQPYRYCDPHRIKLRIHTRYVGTVTSL